MPCKKTIFICDFDGTVTVSDTLVSVFDRFCIGDWWDIENRMRAGQMTRTEALFKEVDLMIADEFEVNRHLENNIEIRSGFSNFLKMVKKEQHELLILSGGFKNWIEKIFSRINSSDSDFSISSNDIKYKGNKKWEFVPNPDTLKPLCSNCPNCKRAVVEKYKKEGYSIIYIGDGDTDFCPSVYADEIYAVSELAEKLAKEGASFRFFKDFNSVVELHRKNGMIQKNIF
jgi:2-hydroxy-3-keto-5-methylthiopentenyl-1-phosphate phosphatase